MYLSTGYLIIIIGMIGYLFFSQITQLNKLRKNLETNQELFARFIEHVNQKGDEIENRKYDLVQSFAGMADFESKFPEDDELFDTAIHRSQSILESHGLNKIRLNRFDASEVMSGRFQ